MLLKPTSIYAKMVRNILNHYRVKHVLHGIAHITGGGLLENTERILPPNVDLVFEKGTWQIPPVFPWLAKLGDIPSDEMDHVFNMGIGMVLVVSPHYASKISELVAQAGYACWMIGTAQRGTGKSRWK